MTKQLQVKAVRVWETGTGKLLGWFPVKPTSHGVEAVRNLAQLTAADCYPTEDEALLAALKLAQQIQGNPPAAYQPQGE